MKRKTSDETQLLPIATKKTRRGYRGATSSQQFPPYEMPPTNSREMLDNIIVSQPTPVTTDRLVEEARERELKWQDRLTFWAKQRQVFGEQIADLTEALKSGDSAATISQLSKESTELWRTVRELKIKLHILSRDFDTHIRHNRVRYQNLMEDRDRLNEQLMELSAKISRSYGVV